MLKPIKNLVFQPKLVGKGSSQSLFLEDPNFPKQFSCASSKAHQGQSFPCLRLVSTLSSDRIFSPLAVP